MRVTEDHSGDAADGILLCVYRCVIREEPLQFVQDGIVLTRVRLTFEGYTSIDLGEFLPTKVPVHK